MEEGIISILWNINSNCFGKHVGKNHNLQNISRKIIFNDFASWMKQDVKRVTVNDKQIVIYIVYVIKKLINCFCVSVDEEILLYLQIYMGDGEHSWSISCMKWRSWVIHSKFYNLISTETFTNSHFQIIVIY